MNIEQKHELMFIIAKYLQTLFPDVAKTFIKRCESENLFPKPVFSEKATFEELETSFLSGVPDDQLIRIISHVQNNSKFASLLASMKQTTQNVNNNSNFVGNEDSGGCFDAKLFDDLICDSLRNQINPLQTVIPPFHRFAAQHRIISHLDKIYCLAVDITSQVLITGSDDFLVKIWKIPEMIPMKVFDVHIDSITDLQIHPSNLYFCSSSHDSTITVFSFKDGGRVVLKLKMDSMVHNIKFSPCGTFLGAASDEGCVSIWNFNEIIEFDKNVQNNIKLKRSDYNIEPIKKINSPKKKPVAWLSFSPNSGFVAFACDPNLIVVSSILENYSVRLRGHTKSPDFVFFSKITCNRILSLSSQERGVRLWESQNDIWDKSAFLSHSQKIKINRATFNCDESRIIGVSSKMIFVWDTFSKQQLFMMRYNEYADNATIVVSHPTLPAVVFIATSKGRSSLWDVINGQFICGLQSEERVEILEAIWSPDGQFIFTSDVLGGVTIYASDPRNKNLKISDQVPYVEMFFLKEVIEIQEKEELREKELREKGLKKKIKENTFKDKNMFLNQAYYTKANDKNYEVNTLITDQIGNPLDPQPERWFLHDLKLRVVPSFSRSMISFSSYDDEETVALNLMKALFSSFNKKKKKKENSNRNDNDNNTQNDINEDNNDDATVVPNFDMTTDSDNNEDDNNKRQGKSSINSDSEYETSFDGENIRLRKKKSKEEAKREREERLKRRHRRLAESENDSGFTSESSIASRRKRRSSQRNDKRKNLSRTPSTTNSNALLRRQGSRIEIRRNNFSSSSSPSSSVDDQEYEINADNENEDENEEYEDEIKFEREIEQEEEEENEEEKQESRPRPQKQRKSSRKQKKSSNISSSSSTKAITRSANRSSANISSSSSTKTVTRSSNRSSANISSSSSSKSVLRTRGRTNQSNRVPSSENSEDTLGSEYDIGYSSSISSDSEPLKKFEIAKQILPSWTFFSKRQIHTFVPQIGDEVVYLRSGHADWKRQCNPMRLETPYQIRSDLPEEAEALISDIRFYVTHLIITLQFYDYTEDGENGRRRRKPLNSNYDKIVQNFALTGKKNRKILFEGKIAYPMPDSPHFIVKKSRFVYSMLYTLSLKVNDIVKVELASDDSKNSKSSKNGKDNDGVQLFKGKIKSIDQDWMKKPWECINVIFTDDKKMGKLQPWELIFDEQKIKKTLRERIMALQNTKSGNEVNIVDEEAEMDRLNDYLLKFVREMFSKKDNSRFVKTRSEDDQKTLRRKSKFPMDLTLLSDRLANHWYTSVESVKHDITLIKTNAQFLIDLDTNFADHIYDQLMEKINIFYHGTEKNKKKATNKSDSESEPESTVDSETDSAPDADNESEVDSETDSESDAPAPNTKTRNNMNTKNQKKKTSKSPQKSTNKQVKKNESPKPKQRLNIQKVSESSTTDSTISSTTSASSSITTTSTDDDE
ncbi:hypothetical protein M9Y10_028146 [Tritrichomonas musculus]|uniref:Bromo domain-containing protein n=1 Tax=Tritrichomonas musculus TaxID=1915356 RepID=A0ABR2KJK5_9EUKA